MSKPESIAESFSRDPMFSRNAAGDPIVRDAKCACGRNFVQRLLSERFLTIVEKSSPRAMSTLRRQIPEYFVPVHCPSCERRDIVLQRKLEPV